MRNHSRFFMLVGAAIVYTGIVCAGEPKVTDLDWEQACGGSNIRVTRVDGRIVSIEAFAEHFYEARQWQCHYTDGQIVSALYRHSKVTRKAVGDAGEFTTELHDDLVVTYHFPKHELAGMPSDLLEDLRTVIAKTNERPDNALPPTATAPSVSTNK
jgi:hypothetical protein